MTDEVSPIDNEIKTDGVVYVHALFSAVDGFS